MCKLITYYSEKTFVNQLHPVILLARCYLEMKKVIKEILENHLESFKLKGKAIYFSIRKKD